MAGPGFSDTHFTAHLQGLEVALSSAAKALIARRCLCPPAWKDKGPLEWGESQPFLATVFFRTRDNWYRGTGSHKNKNLHLSGLRKLQGKVVLWFIVFLSHVFYTSSQRSSSEIKRQVAWQMFLILFHFFGGR